MANPIARAANILMSPRAEWQEIAAEADTVGRIYARYVLILAALPAIAGFLDMSVFGTGIPFTGLTLRVGTGAGLATALFQYGLSLLSVFVLTLLVNAFAPSFGAHKDRVQALKVVAYSYTATWLAGLAVLLPWVGWIIGIAGSTYAVYLLYLGLVPTMRAPPEKAAGYAAVVVVCAFMLSLLTGIGGLAADGAAALGAITRSEEGVEISHDSGSFTINEGTVGKLGQMVRQLEAAGHKMAGLFMPDDGSGQPLALGEAVGALLGSEGETVRALSPEELKTFVPQTLGGLTRIRYAVERNNMLGLQLASAKAGYSSASGESTLEFELTDMGSARSLTAIAEWTMGEKESESERGYERVYQQDGMRVHEQWDGLLAASEYDLIIAERFLVKLRGRGLDMNTVKSAAATLDLAALVKLRDADRKPR